MRKDITKIIIDGNCKLNYAGFYIEGLKQKYNKLLAISYSFKGTNDKEHSFALTVEMGSGEKVNVIIDFHDSVKVDDIALQWSDYYFKINYNTQYLNSKERSLDLSKIHLLPPSFGIRVFNFWQTLFFVLNTILHWNRYSVHTIKNALRACLKRLPISSYTSDHASSSDYIYFTGSIWHPSDREVTIQRAEIVRTLKTLSAEKNITFEGGLIDIGYECDYISNIKSLIYADRKVSLGSYLRNTKKSHVAVNNPAVANCHGWKIGEFMALGKAIISYPAINDTDDKMDQMEAVRFVSDVEELEESLVELISNKELRREYERNARLYWESAMSPAAVIERIFSTLK